MNQLTLLTGFLGAGKTTLMQRILNSQKGSKVGVIVNEFGNVNIDAILIERDGIRMAELTNGSIFCACIKDKFVDSLIEMSDWGLEHIFIEASGLADPANMPQILKGIEPKTSVPYEYKGALCVVDGESFDDLYDLLPAVHNQILYSNVVILNKVDLISEEHVSHLIKKIGKVNPNAVIYTCSYCQVDLEKIMEHLEGTDVKSGETTNTVESKPKTFSVKGKEEVPYEKMQEFIQQVIGDTYRIKGFLNTDRGRMQVSCVGKNIHIEPWEQEIKTNEIVLISSVGIKIISTITKAIDNTELKGILQL